MMRRTKGNVVQSIPFIDANRDDNARCCPGTAVHAFGAHLNGSHPSSENYLRLSYLLWNIADKNKKGKENETYGTGKQYIWKGMVHSITIPDQIAWFALFLMLSSFTMAASSVVSQTPREQRLVLK